MFLKFSIINTIHNHRTLLHCQFTLFSIATSALCKALCLLLCRKLDIPSYAKPMKPFINDAIILLLSFLFFGRFGKIKDISFVKVLCDKSKSVLYDNKQMVQFSCNIF